MQSLKIELSKRWQNKLKRRFDKYEMEVGILKDVDYYLPQTGEPGIPAEMRSTIGQFAGGPVRKRSNTKSGMKVSDIAEKIRTEQKVDWLREPLKNRSNRELQTLINTFFRFAFGRSTERRMENAVRALIRNPILRQDYGDNSPGTVARKGFNRYLFDTGQFFRSIKSRIIKKGR